MSSAVFYLLLLLPCFIKATPLKEFERVARESGFLRPERQSSDSCQSQSDCLATPIVNVTVDFVDCVGGQCVCSDCFSLQNGNCATCPDYEYSTRAQLCGLDSRPKRLTALLLSIFLSSTGAANFYIGQNGLGGGQLFLLLLTFTISYFMCCFPCCLGCCMENPKESLCFIIVQLLAVLFTALAGLATFSWWIADVVIFAQNSRLSGNGCVLAT